VSVNSQDSKTRNTSCREYQHRDICRCVVCNTEYSQHRENVLGQNNIKYVFNAAANL